MADEEKKYNLSYSRYNVNEAVGRVMNPDTTPTSGHNTQLVTSDGVAAKISELSNNVNQQVATIGSKLGDLANLTTTEKSNLVAAINEIKNAIENLSGDAADISYTDTLGLGADNVQDAIDALQNNAQSIFGMTEEDGFYIVDPNGYIGFGIRPNGEVLGGASYRIIEEDTI